MVQRGSPQLRVRLDVGVLQEIDHMVPERQGVGEGLHGERMLGDPGQPKEMRAGARGQDQVVICQLVARTARTVGCGDHLALQVDGVHPTVPEAHLAKKGPQGAHDVMCIDAAGHHLRQHGGEEEKVILVHQGDLDAVIVRERAF